MKKIESVYRGVPISIFVEQCDSRCYFVTEVSGVIAEKVTESNLFFRGMAEWKAVRVARQGIDMQWRSQEKNGLNKVSYLF